MFGHPMALPAWTAASLVSPGDRARQGPGRGRFHEQQHCQAARAYGELAGICNCSCRVVFLRVKLITELQNDARGRVTAPAATSPLPPSQGTVVPGAKPQSWAQRGARSTSHVPSLLPALRPSHPGCLMTSGSAGTPSRCLPAAQGHGHRWRVAALPGKLGPGTQAALPVLGSFSPCWGRNEPAQTPRVSSPGNCY